MGHTLTLAAIAAVAFMVLDGVYFTNYSTLRLWPFVLTQVDVAWGTASSAACAAVARMATR